MRDKRKPVVNYDNEVVSAARVHIYNTLREMRASGEISAEQFAAWLSSPIRDLGGIPNT